MSKVKWFGVLCAALLTAFPAAVMADVVIGNIKIKDSGAIEFADQTKQTTATVQGPQGPQGPKGDEGPPGQVNKDALCQIYSTEGVTLPAFCSKKIIFLTSQKFNGNLGGLTGADAKCQAAATAGGLSGTFKAWLSDSTASAKNRLTHNPAPYIRTDGALVASNWNDLTDGWIKEPIICDEFRICIEVIDDPSGADHNSVWTNTARNGGTYSTCETCNHCLNWTSYGATFPDSGTCGTYGAIDPNWTNVYASEV